MLARDEDILKAAEEWRKSGRGVALATVVETWGSAPRPVGSNLVIDNEGNFLGSVSGGCVEGAVVTEAIDVIDSGKPNIGQGLRFGAAVAVMATIPGYLIYYAVQPLPAALVHKQMILSTIAMLLLGMLLAWLNPGRKAL